MLWFICWLLMVADSPSSHRRIMTEERDYIETSLGANREHELAIRKVLFCTIPLVVAVTCILLENKYLTIHVCF